MKYSVLVSLCYTIVFISNPEKKNCNKVFFLTLQGVKLCKILEII